jgi:asparagine synthase (glutamine-hydrolysing)
MCGWIVLIGRQGQAADEAGLMRAMQSMLHRGPDDSGTFRAGPVAMGFRRLAIIDLGPGGHQPMLSEDGRLALMFNGEIYNYRELRTELEAAGHTFHSSSDTEVLLNAYRQWGRDCVGRFNGMFAFVIHDREDHALFGARDRLGEKPMYHWSDERWTVLASEPVAMGASGLVELRPDWSRFGEAVRDDLMDHGDGTCLAGIRQVPAGHVVAVERSGALQCRPYWSLPATPPDGGGGRDEDWIESLSELVADAVRLRLRSDVPLGFTLSGGIDSSLLMCEAARLGSRDLHAFSYQDDFYDERALIADTVAATGARLEVLDSARLDVAALLPHVVAANGEPVHSMSAVANFALFGLARERGIKVLLGGQSADEVFAGYSSFQHDYWYSLADDGRWSALLADIRSSARLNGQHWSVLYAGVLARTLRLAFARTAPYRALRGVRDRLVGRRAPHPLFARDFWRGLRRNRGEESTGFRLADSQRRALTWHPLPLYLRIEDRVSMAHSVEARLPFADFRLVEHALRMPDRLRFAHGVNKTALRGVAARRVPASVSAQTRKLGFPVGHGERTAIGLQALCRELAVTQAFRERGLYDARAVSALLARPAAPADIDTLFLLAQTELWLSGLTRVGEQAR